MPSPTPTQHRDAGTTLTDILFRKRLPDWWENFAQNPLLVIARRAFATCTSSLAASLTPQQDDPQGKSTWRPSPLRARVVCISDTHNRHAELPPLPPGDILIHAGDLTETGTEEELEAAFAWLSAQPHKHKIVVAGNHDTFLQAPPSRPSPAHSSRSSRISISKPGPSFSKVSSKASEARRTQRDALLRRHPALTYLEDTLTTLAVRGRLLCVYGSPRSLSFPGCTRSRAFQYAPYSHSWRRDLPPLIDILVTHGPPAAHLDWRPGVGCPSLLVGAWRAKPRSTSAGTSTQAAGCTFYEYACMHRAGVAWRALYTLLLVGVAAGTRLGVLWRRRAPSTPASRGTILVNAASAAGHASDGTPRPLQRPIVVDVPLPERL
ncbi:hypothetical protein GSI_14347 [Ganoderma sinense ZZ0214-1]|uniref:Calcineurin-like phosphoesterase domain-containing protein n=1 Tax=Ganoderma sinense ZZ0214-1 TaxID=1077348 RepID=A0A2G8RNG5_9APHY|nr:hypothetical protein GSI_14347 [Ganoderma sinense ZZ0214-1]